MSSSKRFLIIDGYPKDRREELVAAGMKEAHELYAGLLKKYVPNSDFDTFFPSDNNKKIPTSAELKLYSGVLWTGCSLSVCETDNPSVVTQIDLARLIFELGIPSFGSCWALHLAVVAAGGEVKRNPRGREMGVARKIRLTPEGKLDPLMKDKPEVYDVFASHDDEVVSLPENSEVLAVGDFSRVQAAVIKYKNGTFWATQYHPEYNLHEMARLLVAREQKLTDMGFFNDHEAAENLVAEMEELAINPTRKDLRWRLGIDDHLLDSSIREKEFSNWCKMDLW